MGDNRAFQGQLENERVETLMKQQLLRRPAGNWAHCSAAALPHSSPSRPDRRAPTSAPSLHRHAPSAHFASLPSSIGPICCQRCHLSAGPVPGRAPDAPDQGQATIGAARSVRSAAAGPVQVDLFLPLSCGLQRRSLRDAVTGEVLASQEPGQVDLSRLSRDGIMLLQM